MFKRTNTLISEVHWAYKANMNPVTYNALRGEQTFPLPSHVDFVIEITGYAKKQLTINICTK